jgi:hypothetical protein
MPRRLWIAHIGLGGQRAAALVLNLAHQRLGGCGIAGIVDHDGETVAGQPFGDRRTDAARSTGDDRNFASFLGHSQSPRFPLPDICFRW